MKIAGKLVDDTEQVSGKTKLLGVKREQNPDIFKQPTIFSYILQQLKRKLQES